MTVVDVLGVFQTSRTVSEGLWCIWLVLVQSANLIGHRLNLIGQLILIGQAICKTTDTSPLEPGIFAPCLVALGSHRRLTGYVRVHLRVHCIFANKIGQNRY